jgi:hypothetical protein
MMYYFIIYWLVPCWWSSMSWFARLLMGIDVLIC